MQSMGRRACPVQAGQSVQFFDQIAVLWLDFASEMDRAYANGAFIAGSDGFPARWQAEADAFVARQGAQARLGLPYGPSERERFDLFMPHDLPKGLMVFVHGGYWMQSGRETWSHLTAGAIARGWACAMPSYTLAPDARISVITAQVREAVAAAVAAVGADVPLVVTGHSAGGHLAARMACEGGPAGVVRVVPISPVAELAPLMETQMNLTLLLDAAEVALESPARLQPRTGIQAHIWVGGQERPAFLWQARLLSENWDCGWTVAAGKHHFDVIEDLANPDSALMEACLGGL
jgi:arylformamidase